MGKIVIAVDSGCDITPKQQKFYDIKVKPIHLIINGEDRLDDGKTTPQDIFDFVAKTKTLPKTSCANEEEYNEFFKKYVDEGSDVVYIGLSQEISSTTSNAIKSAKNFPDGRVFVVDSRVLSSGIALLAIKARKLESEGKSASEIASILTDLAKNVQTSFVVETLEYLYKGGRCGMLSLLGANLLGIKPRLNLIDGKIVNTGKYRGKQVFVLKKYIDDTLKDYNNYDTDLCFVTHSNANEEVVNEIVEYVKAKGIFKEVVSCTAGSTITSHCGKGTLGILYINQKN